MILYHGTNANCLQAIMTNGIQPRGKHKGTWAVNSQSKFVCLTNTYPIYFAANACKADTDEHLLIEIDCSNISTNRLYPDDDFLWYMAKAQGHNIRLANAGKLITKNQHFWDKSLSDLGCVAHKGYIHFGCITRILQVNPNKMCSKSKMLYFSFADVSVTPVAFKLRQQLFTKQIQWLFGDVCDYNVYSGVNAIDSELKKHVAAINKTKNNWANVVYQR